MQSNVISTETIALHWIGNILLWSFSALCLPFTGALGDGQPQGTGTQAVWLYTPPEARVQSPSWASNATLAVSPVNFDLGANALRETCNLAYGIATTVGATILVCRAASNTIIMYPERTMMAGVKNVSYFETSILVLGWSSTLVGMTATALGQNPKTGWAVVCFEIFSLAGYITCYALQRKYNQYPALSSTLPAANSPLLTSRRSTGDEEPKVAHIARPSAV